MELGREFCLLCRLDSCCNQRNNHLLTLLEGSSPSMPPPFFYPGQDLASNPDHIADTRSTKNISSAPHHLLKLEQ